MESLHKQCRRCEQKYEVPTADQQFYQKVSPVIDGQTFAIPIPELCPNCREQQRLLWRNERKFYNRQCDFSKKDIISVHAPDKPYPVYSHEAWWNDKWDALDYGQEFDFARPFFEQFQELLRRVPRCALYNVDNQNSDYNQCTGWLKDCYMLGGANRNQNCYYGNYVNDCKDCVDNVMIKNCELCYECVECELCYNCSYCKRSNNCTDSAFLVNCSNLKNCFGCVNLVNKEWCLFNQQLTPDEYKQKVQHFDLGNRDIVERLKALMAEHEVKFPVRYMAGTHNEDVTGNGAFHCKNSSHCFDASKLQDCAYSSWLHDSKDCQDIYAWGMPAELSYYCLEVGSGAYQNLFNVTCYNCKSVSYSFQCFHSSHCFGCVGMKSKKYCILNKQYSPEAYEKMVARIIRHMQSTGEWGQFFPAALSGFGYNETIAQELYPLTQDQALQLGALWRAEAESVAPTQKVAIPNDIAMTTSSITKEILTCIQCSRAYRVIAQELAFYQQQHLALPNKCFHCRHQARIELRNPHRLRSTQCAHCQLTIKTSFPTTTKQEILCEDCYQKLVY